ncbi:VanZ family protein [Herbiconiux sp. L3-i23]|uniref:VanZ family protein n=1 Tax=Herbiconiux sp. L3-i23 TaxID=2905871 RepID=UPI00207480E4|nr:VanZ family protein [Herbiconiux sp. L3-i23]
MLVTGGLYLVGIVLIVFWPVKLDTGVRPIVEGWLRDAGADAPGAGSIYSTIEFIANIAVFVPLGALMWWAARVLGLWTPVILAFLAPLVAEVGQGLFLPDRVPDPRDVVAGMIGVAIGTGVGVLVERSRRSDATARD